MIREKKKLSAEEGDCGALLVVQPRRSAAPASRLRRAFSVDSQAAYRGGPAVAAATVRPRAIGVGKMDGHAQTTGNACRLWPLAAAARLSGPSSFFVLSFYYHHCYIVLCMQFFAQNEVPVELRDNAELPRHLLCMVIPGLLKRQPRPQYQICMRGTRVHLESKEPLLNLLGSRKVKFGPDVWNDLKMSSRQNGGAESDSQVAQGKSWVPYFEKPSNKGDNKVYTGFDV